MEPGLILLLVIAGIAAFFCLIGWLTTAFLNYVWFPFARGICEKTWPVWIAVIVGIIFLGPMTFWIWLATFIGYIIYGYRVEHQLEHSSKLPHFTDEHRGFRLKPEKKRRVKKIPPFCNPDILQ